MSCNRPLMEQLEDLRKENRDDPTRVSTLQGQMGNVNYEVEVSGVDSIGCRLRRARVSSTAEKTRSKSRSSKRTTSKPGSSKTTSSVAEQANEFCERVTYLSEDLALMETEESSGVAIARSTTTTPTPNGNGYFEAVVTPQKIDLQRYRAIPSEQRQSTDAAVTHETLQRIVDDAAQSLANRPTGGTNRHRN